MQLLRKTSALIAALLAVFLVTPLVAQSSPAAAPPRPLRLNVIVDVVPGMGDRFDKAWAAVQMAAVERDFPYYTIVNQWGDKRWFLSVIGDYADLGAIKNVQRDLENSGNPAVQAAARTMRELSLSTTTFVSRHDLALSYVPEGSYSGPYHHIRTIEFAPERRVAIADALAKRKDALAKANVKSAFHILWSVIGAKPDSVSILSSAPNPEAHEATQLAAANADPAAAKAFADAIWRNSRGERAEFWLARAELRISATLKKGTNP